MTRPKQQRAAFYDVDGTLAGLNLIHVALFMLANGGDQHGTKIFDPSIKGETDRFAYRFLKA